MANSRYEILCNNESETAAFGSRLGSKLAAGDVVALVGELGAGKTRLVQSIAESFGVDRREVTSPTFVLIQEYAGRLPIYHFDTYRLRNLDEFLELGAEELLDSNGICLIEWADRVADVLPADTLRCEIRIIDETTREFRLTAHGPRSSAIIDSLRT